MARSSRVGSPRHRGGLGVELDHGLGPARAGARDDVGDEVVEPQVLRALDGAGAARQVDDSGHHPRDVVDLAAEGTAEQRRAPGLHRRLALPGADLLLERVGLGLRQPARGDELAGPLGGALGVHLAERALDVGLGDAELLGELALELGVAGVVASADDAGGGDADESGGADQGGLLGELRGNAPWRSSGGADTALRVRLRGA